MKIYENLNINNLELEVWKVIKDLPDYSISNLGRVKSLKFGREKILKQNINSNDYLRIRFSNKKQQIVKFIHRLVLETFKPIKNSNKFDCNHINGIKTDNKPENLEWCTKSINMKHAYITGLKISTKGKHYSEESKNKIRKNHANFKGKNHPMFGSKKPGEKSGNHILITQDIIQIKLLLKEGKLTQQEIADIFCVCRQTISLIKTKKIWSHIKLN